MFGKKSSVSNMTIFFIIFTFILFYSKTFLSLYAQKPIICLCSDEFFFCLIFAASFASYLTLPPLILSTFRNNTITTIFWIYFWKYCLRSKQGPTDWACEVGKMSGCDITSTDNIEFCNWFTLQWVWFAKARRHIAMAV